MITDKVVNEKVYHNEHNIDIKITNDNTKSVRNCTVHVRTDGDPQDAIKLAIQLYKDGLAN